MKKVKLVQAFFTQEEIAAINTKNIKLEEENKNMKLILEQMENTCKDYLNDRDTLREENGTLKANIEFLHQCLDDRENSIELMKHRNKLQEKALIKLCLKHHYDNIIIEGEEVIDMSNYKVVEKEKPKEEKLF